MPTAEISAVAADYAELARRPLDADQCALVVIDIQEKLLPPIFQREQLVRNSQLLIRAVGILKIPTLLSTQYAKGLGSTVPEIASLLPGSDAIDKTLFSCFGSDTFCSVIKPAAAYPQHPSALRHGKSYLCNADWACCSSRRIFCPCRVRCGQLSH